MVSHIKPYGIIFLLCVALSICAGLWWNHHQSVPTSGIGRGINIGNALEAPRDTPWAVTMDIAFLDAIDQAGFDTVRLPVRFSDYVGPGPDYSIEETFLQEIDQYVDRAMDLGLILILDLHHFIPLMEAPQDYEPMFCAIWSQLATRYQDYPETLIFELLNEPRGVLTPEVWNEMFPKALACVRETNPTRKVIIDAPLWGSADGIVQLELPNDGHIVATFHYYDPMMFTFQSDPYQPGYEHYHDVIWSGTEGECAALNATFSQVSDWAKGEGVEVLLGEFGANQYAPKVDRIRWTEAVIQEAQTHGFGWCYWELGAQFGVYDILSKQWDADMLAVMMSN